MKPMTSPLPATPSPAPHQPSLVSEPATPAQPQPAQTPLPPQAATQVAGDNPLSRRRPTQLSPAWQKIFQKTLKPTAAQVNNNGYPHRTLQPPLQTPENPRCGSSFQRDYNGLRIWWNNANTLLQQDGYAELHELCLTLKEYNVGVIALQELNLNVNRLAIRTAIENVFLEHFGTCKLVMATTPCHSPTAWKPGGTLLVVLGSWSHAVTHTIQDQLGRWCGATLSGTDGSLVSIYSFYNVVKNNIDQAGPSTVFAQQWQVLCTTGITSP